MFYSSTGLQFTQDAPRFYCRRRNASQGATGMWLFIKRPGNTLLQTHLFFPLEPQKSLLTEVIGKRTLEQRYKIRQAYFALYKEVRSLVFFNLVPISSKELKRQADVELTALSTCHEPTLSYLIDKAFVLLQKRCWIRS